MLAAWLAIGSWVAESYTKDTEDASLTYTYTRDDVGAFISVETGPQCQPGEPFCLRAGMISLVEVYDAAGTTVGVDFNKALMWSMGGATLWESQTDGVTPWPWEIEESGVGGFLEYVVSLSQPVTNEVDLSAVALGEEFTVVYTLYAYSLDTSADAGLFRAAEAFARDPLGGDIGVRFGLAGITPTNNPSVRPVPEPASGMLLLAALAALGLRRRAIGARSFAHVAIAIAALGGSATSARATILLFDQERDPTTQSVVSPTAAGSRRTTATESRGRRCWCRAASSATPMAARASRPT